MVEVQFSNTSTQQPFLRLAVSYGQPLDYEGELSWLDFHLQPVSARLGRPVSWEEDCEEWLRALAASYQNAPGLGVQVLRDDLQAPVQAPPVAPPPSAPAPANPVPLPAPPPAAAPQTSARKQSPVTGLISRLSRRHLILLGLLALVLLLAVIIVPRVGSSDEPAAPAPAPNQQQPATGRGADQPASAEVIAAAKGNRQKPKQSIWRKTSGQLLKLQQQRAAAESQLSQCRKAACLRQQTGRLRASTQRERRIFLGLVGPLRPRSACVRAIASYDVVLAGYLSWLQRLGHRADRGGAPDIGQLMREAASQRQQQAISLREVASCQS